MTATGTGAEPVALRPGKVIAIHLNYPSRAEQRGRTPAFASYFLKPTTSVATSGGEIERPAGAELLAFEGEIALVIGRRARRVSPDQAWSYVGGVTAGNDFGVYDLRAADRGSNLRSKGGDGFTPLGPAVLEATGLDPRALRVRTWLNGGLVQDDDTSALLFPLPQIVADLSQLVTLEPGDIILTGTPAGSSVAVPGDVIEVEVDAPAAAGTPTTGRLRTTVTEGQTVWPAYSAPMAVDDTQRREAWGTPAAPPVLDEDLRALLSTVGVATLSVQLRKRGFDDSTIDGVRVSTPGTRTVGLARTLRYVAFRPDLFATHGGGFNAQKRAVESLQPGEVLVMEARGERGTGTLGDVLALRALTRGAAGIVTDGGIRDFAAVSAIGLPTWSLGPHPAVLGRRHVPWDTDITITCGGATVQPGDVIVGDDDGVVVIPPGLVREVAEAAAAQEAEEQFVLDRVREGEGLAGLFPMDAAWRARYEQDREGR